MADGHTIVIRVKDGKISEVLFCDCCPILTVEIRTYTDSMGAAAVATSAWYVQGGNTQPSQFKRDEVGVYETSFYEPDAGDD
jgi:hypothetical protein